MSVENQQIREYDPIGNPLVTLGAAVQVVNFDTTLSHATNLIAFGASEVVTTVPANDPLVAAWLTNISITINGTHEIVRDFTRAEYVDIVQNLEMMEADLISNGNMLFKKFDPPLPAGTRIQISLTVNTLALATTTPAATGVIRMSLNTYDSQNIPFEKKLIYYQRIPEFPQPAGVIAGTPVQQDLGTEIKTVKWIILNELTGGALSDTFSGRYELVVDGNTKARINETTAKKHYQLISDGLAVPVGRKLLKLPGRGWNASQARTLHIRCTPHTNVVNGSWNGFQILEKPYQ